MLCSEGSDAVKLSRYVLRRFAQMVPVLFAIVVINFVLLHAAPGDPATVLAGPYANQRDVARMRMELGLDKPLPVQFLEYLKQLLHGDLGHSYTVAGSVLTIILHRLPATLILVIPGQIIGLILGVSLGTLAARRQGSHTDRGLSLMTTTAYSMPIFWLSPLLVWIFAITLHWLPATGMHSLFGPTGGFGRFTDLIKHLILPVTAFTLAYTLPTYYRLARASVLEVSREDYITTARAKGLPEHVVFYKHA